jgi:methionyl-tRNA synthetase
MPSDDYMLAAFDAMRSYSLDRMERSRDDFVARCCPHCGEEMGDGAYLDCDECGHEVTADDVAALHSTHAPQTEAVPEQCEYAICAAWAVAHA